jgi:processive 1,2-diacylglycerol beta-glucosyltransferase
MPHSGRTSGTGAAGSVRRVLVVSVKAGAGHMRAAEAVAAAIRETRADIEVRHIEALSVMSRAFRKTYTAGYEKLVRSFPSVWGAIYGAMERRSARSRVKRLVTRIDAVSARGLVEAVGGFSPDRIVCTHYLPAEVLGARRKRRMLSAPVFVTLTDYDIHTMWLHEGVDGYFVATDEMAYALRAKGTQASIEATGIPIMPVFSRQWPQRPEMRRRLGLDAGMPAVLVSAGGFGFAKVDELACEMARAAEGVQFLVVAGRNERLRRQVEAAAAKYPGRIRSFGFVDNMHELMAASDILVSKPGGLTTSEALAMGLAMVVVDPIPGQEERNSDFLLESGAAVRASSPAHLVYKLGHLMADGERLDAMRAAARRVAKPRAAFDVAERVLDA